MPTTKGVSAKIGPLNIFRAPVALLALSGLMVVMGLVSIPSQAFADISRAPECSIIDPRDEPIEIIVGSPPRISASSQMEIECHIFQDPSQPPMEVATELGNPKWRLGNDKLEPREGKTITTSGFTGALVVKLEGAVPWPKSRKLVKAEESYGYWTDVAPPQNTRVISVGQPAQGASSYHHFEVLAVHPLDWHAVNAVARLSDEDKFTAEARRLAKPLIEEANGAIAEGRPWLALLLVEQASPSLKALSPTLWDRVEGWALIFTVCVVVIALAAAGVWYFFMRERDVMREGDTDDLI